MPEDDRRRRGGILRTSARVAEYIIALPKTVREVTGADREKRGMFGPCHGLPSRPTRTMADQPEGGRNAGRWQAPAALAVGGAAALVGIWMARDSVSQAVTMAATTVHDEATATVEAAGTSLLSSFRQTVTTVAAKCQRMVYEAFPGAAPPASIQNESETGEITGRIRQRASGPSEEGAQVRARRMRHENVAAVPTEAVAAPAPAPAPEARASRVGCVAASPSSAVSASTDLRLTSSSSQPDPTVPSVDDFDSLVAVHVRDREHLLELLALIETSADNGDQLIDTIFLGTFRTPSGFGRFPGKAKIVSVERAIGEVVCESRSLQAQFVHCVQHAACAMG